MEQQRRRSGFAPHRLLSMEDVFQTFQWFAQMRASQPVFYDEQTHLWQIFRYDDVNEVVTDYNRFSSESLPGFSENTFLEGTIVATDPPQHRKLRNLVNQAFTPRAVNELSGRVAEITQELLDDVKERGRLDIVSDIAFPLPAKVIAEMLGVPAEDWDIFRRWVSGADIAVAKDRESAMRMQHSQEQQMYDYFVQLLDERRRAPKDDLISDLSVAEVDGERLSERELVSFCLLLLAAGQETTKNLIANAAYCFTEYPEARERLMREPGLMQGAVEEILRYLPPVWFTLRRAKTDLELAGQHIPANAIIQAWNASANRDAAQFSEPEHFAIERQPNKHLSFGHGIHFCIGAPLARLEANVALPMILSQLKNLERVPDVPVRISAGIVFVIRSLPMTFQAR
ncbi:MAG TPA: cytochrome P450 [Herpetosiphonaceae bacterium]